MEANNFENDNTSKDMKKIVTTANAPAPIGPYNQAVLAGNTLYISGQIPIDPKTGDLVSGDIKKETEQSMQNLKAILAEAGMTFENVVKSSIFVKDMHQFSQINEVYGAYFDADTAPARETVEVANLPKFVNVEISMIAVK
jgi:2-iminobutanoate/2-iminopropanoate deaminase